MTFLCLNLLELITAKFSVPMYQNSFLSEASLKRSNFKKCTHEILGITYSCCDVLYLGGILKTKGIHLELYYLTTCLSKHLIRAHFIKDLNSINECISIRQQIEITKGIWKCNLTGECKEIYNNFVFNSGDYTSLRREHEETVGFFLLGFP